MPVAFNRSGIAGYFIANHNGCAVNVWSVPEGWYVGINGDPKPFGPYPTMTEAADNAEILADSHNAGFHNTCHESELAGDRLRAYRAGEYARHQQDIADAKSASVSQ